MSLSAATVALLLTIAPTALGAEAGPGEVREGDVTTTTEVVEANEEPVVSHPEDEALYGHFFGEPDAVAPAEQDAPVVQETQDMAIPWWLLPFGMLGVGVLFLMRGRAVKSLLPQQDIRVLSRTQLGKEGSLAVIEVADGDHRKRRLVVGLGGGAPRLVADVSAWDVAVAAPSMVEADEPRMVVGAPSNVEFEPVEAPVTLPAQSAEAPFGHALQGAAARYSAAMGETPQEETHPSPAVSHGDLVAEVLALRDAKPLNGDQTLKTLKTLKTPKTPGYSRRTVVA